MGGLVPAKAVPLGVGCSRLGSVAGAGPHLARTLIQRALDDGVRLFDTANIYGQGDSERLLGDSIGSFDDVVIISKAGKYFSWQRRLLLPVKGALRASASRSSNAKARVALARAKPMPNRWDSHFLTKSLEGSLRRLRRECIDVFLLHSPSEHIVLNGQAVDALEKARTQGKIGTVGVSVDDPETATACLADARIRALQIPLWPGKTNYDQVITQANEAGVAIIAREIFGGASGLRSHTNPAESARKRIIQMVRDPAISVPLVGVTRIQTLAASIDAAKSAARGDHIGFTQASADGDTDCD